MTSVVVVSRTSAIGMSLGLQGLVVEEWLQRIPGTAGDATFDVALIDLTSNLLDPPDCLAALRGVHPDLPLVVLGDRRACQALLPNEADFLLAQPPISAADVAVLLKTAALGRRNPAAATEGQAATEPEAIPDEPDPAIPADPPAFLDLSLLEAKVAPAWPIQQRAHVRWRLPSGKERGAAGGSSTAVEEGAVEPPSPAFFAVVDAVEKWLPSVVAVTAISQILLEGVVADLRAEAGAVLLREQDGTWLVVAGVGLRPLEYRSRLDDEHWVVRRAALTGSALRIEDTDIARQRLIGLPLAGSRHLLVSGIGERQALLVLGRCWPAFAEHDVQAALSLCTEADPHFAGAVRLRWLCRALTDYDDLPAESR